MNPTLGAGFVVTALLLAPMGAQAGFLDKVFGGGGGGRGGGKADAPASAPSGGGGHKAGGGGGHQGGGGSVAFGSGLAGGIAAVMNGGSFSDGFKEGRKAASDPGQDGDLKQAAQAGKASAAGGDAPQGGSSHHHGSGISIGGLISGILGGSSSGGSGGKGDPEDGGSDSQSNGSSGQTGVSGGPTTVRPPRPLPPEWASLPPVTGTNHDGDGTDEDEGTGEIPAVPPDPNYRLENGKPAPPSQLASLDTPKRYQTLVPQLPPGREYKGGRATAAEMADHQKLGMDAVASVQGVVVNTGAMTPPASKDHPEGARRLASGARVDGRDAERALRATVTSGESRFGLKDYKGAMAEAEAAIELAPNRPEGYLLYAKTLNRMGLHAKAEEMALKAKALSTDLASLSKAQLEATQALLFQGRTTDAMASANEVIGLGQKAGNKGLEANGYFLLAAACQLKGDRDCMTRSLERAALLDSKYYAALDDARAGKNIFDPKDTESLGLLDSVSGDAVPLPRGVGALGGVLVLLFAGLAGAAGWAWRRSHRPAAPTVAETFGVKKDDGLLAGKYELGRAVPSGGRGEMWEAQDRSLGRTCHVLRLSSPAAAEEARRLAQMHHPNVVDVFEVVESPNGFYMVVEFIKGRSLRQVLSARGAMSVDEARRMLKPVCEALEFARGQGAVLGGLDLSSIVLSDDGFVKVVDLASARSEDAGRTDVQALAACLGELLTGEPPRAGTPPAVGLGAAALLRESAAGAVSGPAAFAARLDALADGVAVG